MSKVKSAAGIIKTFWWMTREEWQELDHKFYRLALGAVFFILMALFWFYFLRNILPF